MQDSHFSYGWVPKARVAVSFLAFLCFVFLDLKAVSDDEAGLGIFLFALTIFLMALSALFLVSYSGVFINPQAIGSTVFGRKWKSIEWADVTTITVTHPADFQGGRDTLYWIGAASSKKTFASPKGRVMFTKSIRDLDALIGAINRYCVRGNVDIRDDSGVFADPAVQRRDGL